MRTFKFLFYQIIRNRKNLIFVVLGLILISASLVYNLSQIKDQRIYQQIHLRQLEYSYEDLSQDESVCVDDLKKRIDFIKEVLSSDDISLIYDCHLGLIELDLKEGLIEANDELLLRQEYIKYLKEKELTYEDYEYPVLGFTFTFFSFVNIIGPLVLIGLIWILSDLYTRKYVGKHNIYQSMLSKKISAWDELKVGLTLCFGSVFVFLIFSWFITGSLGSLKYPVLIDGHFVVLKEIVIRVFVYFVMLLFFFVTMILTLANVVKKVWLTRLLSLILFGVVLLLVRLILPTQYGQWLLLLVFLLIAINILFLKEFDRKS